MKGLICYFSTTGNTKLVCEAIAAKVKIAEWVFYDLTDQSVPILDDYDIIGLATYTDFWGPPQKVQSFVENLVNQHGNKSAFILNTHAGESGKTLMILNDWLKSKGFNVIAGHSLIMPVNYPPALSGGWNNAGDPSEQDIQEFNKFIFQLTRALSLLKDGEKPQELLVNIDERNMSFPFAVRTTAKEDMGEVFVDVDLCTKCGICKKVCPY